MNIYHLIIYNNDPILFSQVFGAETDRYNDILQRSFVLVVKCLSSPFEDLVHLSLNTVTALIGMKHSTLKTPLEAAYERSISKEFLSRNLQPILGPILTQNLVPPKKLTVQKVDEPPHAVLIDPPPPLPDHRFVRSSVRLFLCM